MTDSLYHHFCPRSQKSRPVLLCQLLGLCPRVTSSSTQCLATPENQLGPPLLFLHPCWTEVPTAATPPHLLPGGPNLSLGGGEGNPLTFPSIITYSLPHHPPQSRGSRYFWYLLLYLLGSSSTLLNGYPPFFLVVRGHTFFY